VWLARDLGWSTNDGLVYEKSCEEATLRPNLDDQMAIKMSKFGVKLKVSLRAFHWLPIHS